MCYVKSGARQNPLLSSIQARVGKGCSWGAYERSAANKHQVYRISALGTSSAMESFDENLLHLSWTVKSSPEWFAINLFFDIVLCFMLFYPLFFLWKPWLFCNFLKTKVCPFQLWTLLKSLASGVKRLKTRRLTYRHLKRPAKTSATDKQYCCISQVYQNANNLFAS